MKNDDIKQILRDLEFASGVFDYTITPNRCSFLKDYITNLQQENERLKLNDREWQLKYDVLENVNNVYEISVFKEKEDYKSRCGKAVEYIKQNCITSDSWEDLGFCNFVPIGKITYKGLSKSKIKDLLNILNGRSDE